MWRAQSEKEKVVSAASACANPAHRGPAATLFATVAHRLEGQPAGRDLGDRSLPPQRLGADRLRAALAGSRSAGGCSGQADASLIASGLVSSATMRPGGSGSTPACRATATRATCIPARSHARRADGDHRVPEDAGGGASHGELSGALRAHARRATLGQRCAAGCSRSRCHSSPSFAGIGRCLRRRRRHWSRALPTAPRSYCARCLQRRPLQAQAGRLLDGAGRHRQPIGARSRSCARCSTARTCPASSRVT